MISIFHKVSNECSRITTECYSTSFSSAIKLLHKSMQPHIHNIYGFVRFADEIVDTFHQYDKVKLLADFKRDTYAAVEEGISLNPILHSFQVTVNRFNIDLHLVDAFFRSMEFDLQKRNYNVADYEEYIYGSAEVVGLMCLCVFCDGNKELYEKLKTFAMSLGAAFQKVNFLRDIRNDYEGLNRMYFPGCDFNNFSSEQKLAIEADIQHDFDIAYAGILMLPVKSKFGVYVAYKYYLSLFKKIKRTQPGRILDGRIRIPGYGKMFILAKAGLRSQFNFL